MVKANYAAILLSILIMFGTTQANAQCPQRGQNTVPPKSGCPCPMMQGTPQHGGQTMIQQGTQPQTHTNHQNGVTGGAAMMEDHSQMMLQQLGSADQNYDRRFIDMIIHHHSEAIVVGQDAVRKAQHPQLRQFAQKMIEEQRRHIQQLQTWRRQWYGQ